MLDPDMGTLLKDQIPITVGHRGLTLLAALTARPGEILTKAELMDAAWPGTAVEEGNLTVQIATLRKALGPADNGGEWIATVPRLGYRFTGAVEPVASASYGAIPPPGKPSIAVLPFVNSGGDPDQQYLSDGITEDIITELARFRSLLVIARNSSFQFRHPALDTAEAHRKLGVRYLVAGSIRKLGDRIRITTQLIDAATGTHLWAQRYDRALNDIFALQDEVAALIASMVEGQAEADSASRSRRKRPTDWDAYDYYLQGRAHFYRYELDKADPSSRSVSSSIRHSLKVTPSWRRPSSADFGTTTICGRYRRPGTPLERRSLSTGAMASVIRAWGWCLPTCANTAMRECISSERAR
ncbi:MULTISPECIES: winged helix-turn-helix domain-containing protein [unclassified Mesorhizobium]|uniref:winged helix-turn-helix domain-containing protein n=1 Tax=unclassified Mesorhizobium TaxID=325217 RepID=UPI001FDEE2FE|nr:MULTISPECIES: winged helix-turn-helix domain-containing protein [unclassified Mesorhizobium]